jgi:transcriptional regulator with XRE-family HTH domain
VSASLGPELKSRREAVGLTQGAVAKQLGVSRPTLTQWEGDKHRPTPEHLIRLDEIYGARGELIRLAEITPAEEPEPPRLFLSDVFRNVADALVAALARDEKGRPRGWSRNLLDRKPSRLSTAYAVRTLQLLDDARVDLHQIAEIFAPSENPNGWGYRSGPAPRPEVSAVIFAMLSRLGRLDSVDGALQLLDDGLSAETVTRPFVVAVVLEAVLTIRPEAPLVGRLLNVLLDARTDESRVWTVNATAPAELVVPSLAHTARVTAVLRLAQPVVARNDVDEAIGTAVDWMVSRHNHADTVTEVLESKSEDRTAEVPVHHFTPAWVIRALAGVEGVPEHRLQTDVDALWDAYSPHESLWVRRIEGSLPSWMTHDAVAALRFLATTAFRTPVAHP